MTPINASIRALLQNARFKVLDEKRCESPWLLAPLRDLLDHETRGGHACNLHVGKPVQELHSRISSDANLAVVSSFWTRDCATAAVCHLTMSGLDRIIQWACGNLARVTIEDVVPVKSSIGYAIIRGNDRVAWCNRARMILERDMGVDFHILTAYPVP